MTTWLRTGWLMALLTVAGCRPAIEGPDVKPALDTAESWLALLDAGQYDASWEQASAHFQKKVSKPLWGKLLEGKRKELGSVTQRTLTVAEHHPDVPGAPEGMHFRILFESSFELLGKGKETMFVTLEPDGVCRVIAYYPP